MIQEENEYQDKITIYADYLIKAENAKKEADAHLENGLTSLSAFFKNKETKLLEKAEKHKRENNLDFI